MVGGKVIEVLQGADFVWVNVKGENCYSNQECALRLERNEKSEQVKPGDSLWWQGCVALWTPIWYTATICGGRKDESGIFSDIEIPRIGYSGSPHPAKHIIEKAFP